MYHVHWNNDGTLCVAHDKTERCHMLRSVSKIVYRMVIVRAKMFVHWAWENALIISKLSTCSIKRMPSAFFSSLHSSQSTLGASNNFSHLFKFCYMRHFSCHGLRFSLFFPLTLISSSWLQYFFWKRITSIPFQTLIFALCLWIGWHSNLLLYDKRLRAYYMEHRKSHRQMQFETF